MRQLLARLLVSFGVLAAAFSASATAGGLDAPKGEVVLTVSGLISKTNVDKTARFDMAMLHALPVTTFKTTTTWTTGEVVFTGVSLHTLMAAVGAEGSTIHSMALNDYSIDIPVKDAVAAGPIIAYAMDGKPMSARDKGPLWIVYPYDSSPHYRTEEVYSRSIWQLTGLEFQK